jgi:hypothetical protein
MAEQIRQVTIAMATMIRERAPKASGFANSASNSRRQSKGNWADLIDQLVIAFFVAMVVVWVVTQVVGVL